MNPIKKVILGTAQFGLDYGINNNSGQVSSYNVDSILLLANSLGIKFLDTSYAYGNSETIIGNSQLKNSLSFNLISKYPKSDYSVESLFEESLKRLRVCKLYGYLVHNFDSFVSNPDIWKEFINLKKIGKVLKIGFSIYSVNQLQFLINNNVKFDLIQFPFNIFDKQFYPYLEKLKHDSVEIHTRSVFLQGLFFKSPNTLTGNLIALKPELQSLHSYCLIKKIEVQQLALNYVVGNPNIDRVLIGVDNICQFNSNINALNKGIKVEDVEFINSISISKPDLLNPINWKLN